MFRSMQSTSGLKNDFILLNLLTQVSEDEWYKTNCTGVENIVNIRLKMFSSSDKVLSTKWVKNTAVQPDAQDFGESSLSLTRAAFA